MEWATLFFIPYSVQMNSCICLGDWLAVRGLWQNVVPPHKVVIYSQEMILIGFNHDGF